MLLANSLSNYGDSISVTAVASPSRVWIADRSVPSSAWAPLGFTAGELRNLLWGGACADWRGYTLKSEANQSTARWITCTFAC
jgi:hypothetical protein